MRVHRHTVLDIETGRVLADDAYEYCGPVALCDRSLVNTAKAGAANAAQGAGVYGTQARNTYATAMPLLTHLATNAPGLAPATYGMIQSGELSAGAGKAADMDEKARLAAARTGNAAAAGALGTAGAEAAARGIGANMLGLGEMQAKTQLAQQEAGLRGLEGLYGQSVRGQTALESLIPKDVNAATAASKVGWLQNMEGILRASGRVHGEPQQLLLGLHHGPSGRQRGR